MPTTGIGSGNPVLLVLGMLLLGFMFLVITLTCISKRMSKRRRRAQEQFKQKPWGDQEKTLAEVSAQAELARGRALPAPQLPEKPMNSQALR